jgi:hypothetical protein
MCSNNVVPYERFLAKQLKRKAMSILPENRGELRIDLTGWVKDLQESMVALETAMKENGDSEQQQ